MGAPSVDVISNAKPVASGGIKVGPLGTDLPTDATSEPGAELKGLGYVNEDGLRPEGERSVESIKDWGGDVIAQLQTEHSSRFVFTLYGVFDPDVLKTVFGDENVSGEAGAVTVLEDGAELPHLTWLFDVRGTGGKKVRICIPDGQVTTVTEAPLVAGALQSFELTVEAYKDSEGTKVYRYYSDGTTPDDPGTRQSPTKPVELTTSAGASASPAGK